MITKHWEEWGVVCSVVSSVTNTLDFSVFCEVKLAELWNKSLAFEEHIHV